eukprot:1160036-Pelagomonas_calceolata.AAC.1
MRKAMRKAVLTTEARFWSRALPLALQIPISMFCFVASWWRGLMTFLGRVSSAYVIFLFFEGHNQRGQNNGTHMAALHQKKRREKTGGDLLQLDVKKDACPLCLSAIK